MPIQFRFRGTLTCGSIVRRTALLLLGVCAVANPPRYAAAQQLEEIVVTAERRETALQDTPISIMAFSAETMEVKGMHDLMDIATITPNLDIKGSRGNGNVAPTYEIRGVSGGGGATGERAVGFYLDNVFLPRTTGPVMKTLDIDRIEVLRGPQGTLFGRNSVGGAIRVFTQQPKPEKDGYLKLTGGNFDHYDINGMLNVPVNDHFFLRGQAAYLHQDGFVDRGTQKLGGSKDVIGRLQAAFEPNDDFSLTVGLMYTKTDADGSPQDLVLFDMNPACPSNSAVNTICYEGNYADWMSDFLQAAGQPRLSSNDPRLILDDYTMPDFCFLDDANPDWDAACEQYNNNHYFQADANLTWDINDNLKLTSTSAYSKFGSRGVSDWQLLGMEKRLSEADSEVFYQEFQLNFALLDKRIDTVVGANYFRENSDQPRGALLNAFGSSTFSPQAANGNLYGCPSATPCTPSLRRSADTELSQTANAFGLFVNGTWHVVDRLNLTGGLRWSYDRKSIDYRQYTAYNFNAPAPGYVAANGRDHWNELDWRGTVDFNLTEDIMLYATASKAFRSGSFSFISLTPAQTGTAYNGILVAAIPPEKLKNYEGGIRTEWFTKRLRFNLTYFDMNYTDRQGASAVVDPTAPTGFVIQLVNQGNVALNGAELDGQWAVTDKFTIDGSAGWIGYKMKDPCTNNGTKLFPAPAERSFSVGGRYLRPLAVGGTVTIGMNYGWVGEQHTHPGGLTSAQNTAFGCPNTTPTLFLDSRYKLDSYGLLNGTIRYDSAGGRWSATLYGNNLTDETYGNFAQSFGGGYWDATAGPASQAALRAPLRRAVAITRGRPIEWGITFQYHFFK